mmetsp:Transcript_2771/g.7722  ORF Transcript_2771/g.7722 Transcript_2771/m.7722 type:complete len:590 (+) Transcript_2771:76-1845(+)
MARCRRTSPSGTSLEAVHRRIPPSLLLLLQIAATSATTSANTSGPSCPVYANHGECSGNGKCVISSQGASCECKTGYEGADCSRATFCPSNCHNHGRCVLNTGSSRHLPGKCECQSGFTGDACQEAHAVLLPTYDGKATDCVNSCSGHGMCSCGAARRMNQSRTVRVFDEHGHAVPDATVTEEVSVDVRGVRIDSDVECHCNCQAGYEGTTCERVSNSGSGSCPDHCSGKGLCGPDGTCTCNAGYAGASCDIMLAATCPNACSGHGHCQSNGTCACHANFAGAADCSVFTPPSTAGLGCSGNGLLLRNGTCQCRDGFAGTTCDTMTFACAHLSNCSAHGYCERGQCICNVGAFGPSCELKRVQWVSADASDPGLEGRGEVACQAGCSGHGSCVLGRCVCDRGYGASACDRAVSAAAANHAVDAGMCANGCSGNGHCLSVLPSRPRSTVTDGASPTGAAPSAAARPGLVGRLLSRFGGHVAGDAVALLFGTGEASTAAPSASSPALAREACDCEAGFGGADCARVIAACHANCSGAGICRVVPVASANASVVTETVGSRDVAPVCLCQKGRTGRGCELRDTSLSREMLNA